MSLEISELVKDFSPASMTLSASSRLSAAERALIEELQETRIAVAEGDAIIQEGDMIDRCFVVRSGWLARQRTTREGGMITTNVYLPGDLIAVHLGFKRRALFDIVALTKAEVAVVDAARLHAISTRSHVVAAALDWSAVRSFNIVSEHVVGVSTRPAAKRVLHLLLELWCRLIVVGQASDDAFALPLSQREIGEMAGLSLVSVNRGLQTLRRNNLLTLEDGEVRFCSMECCMEYCDFDGDFLEIFTPIGLADLNYYVHPSDRIAAK